jgi:preprotein translocase SecE subunit
VATKQKKSQKAKTSTENQESIVRVFFRGFFLPARWLGRGLAWLAHHPPLKQIGHALRWFFHLRPVRFVGRMLGYNYIRSSARELKTVTWPTWRESRKLTVAVIIFSIIFGALVAAVDYVLDKIFKQILLN